MKHKLNIILKKYSLFLFLLPLFFVLHGYTENYDFVPVKDAVLLLEVYIVASIVLFLLSYLLFRNSLKAAVLAALFMAFHFFFGSMHDAWRSVFPGLFLSKYVFFLPASFCVLLLIIILLKRRKTPLSRLAFYLNFLFLLLVVMDGIWLTGKVALGHKERVGLPKELFACINCERPDVYIIITDEYAGNTELKDIFHFDNSAFTNELSKRGFHTIPYSSSNYNYTPYSIASTLNMHYLDLNRTGKKPLLTYSYDLIRDNKFLQFFQHHQYQFYNFSFFNFKGQPSQTQETFLPASTRLITSQTFLSRINKELRFNLITRFNSKREQRNLVYANKKNNEDLLRLTVETASRKISQPKFVLTHLMMPHYPYYFDKDGKEFPFETLVEGQQPNRQHYIEYLQYGNKKLLALIDHILTNSASPPVIILIGDHGFRHFNDPVDPKYYFSNLMSVHLPGKNYTAFRDSLTNVNLLRTVLNTTFNQRLSYIKDTTFIMENP